MNKETYITHLNNRTLLIERCFYYKGDEYVEVLAYDKLNKMLEPIGTSYSEMPYYYNKDYVVLVKDEEVEFAFDTRKFSFITDEKAKMRAFNKILNSSKIDYTKEESNLEIEEAEKRLIKKLCDEN